MQNKIFSIRILVSLGFKCHSFLKNILFLWIFLPFAYDYILPLSYLVKYVFNLIADLQNISITENYETNEKRKKQPAKCF